MAYIDCTGKWGKCRILWESYKHAHRVKPDMGMWASALESRKSMIILLSFLAEYVSPPPTPLPSRAYVWHGLRNNNNNNTRSNPPVAGAVGNHIGTAELQRQPGHGRFGGRDLLRQRTTGIRVYECTLLFSTIVAGRRTYGRHDTSTPTVESMSSRYC